ncbi:MAG: recombination mediator RecR [Patescibacteria group bacterium]
MPNHPETIQNLIQEFNKLPGIGEKTSERFVFYLLKQPKAELEKLGLAIEHLKDKIKICSVCQNFGQSDPCQICGDKSRDQRTICVVAEPQDILALEKTGEYKGVYHVLYGVLRPIEGVTPDKLKIDALLSRVKKSNIKEIIIALNPDMEGESTTLYLKKLFSPFGLKITRLGRGLAMGSELEYADEITLTNALAGRKEV